MANARLPIVPHLTTEEIARRYRACRSGVQESGKWLSVARQQTKVQAD